MQTYFYTALLDVLSYKHRLDSDIKSGRHSFKDNLEKSLSIFDQVNSAIFNVQAISDTVIVTCAHHQNFPEFLQILKTVFINFLKQGLFVRGGVAYSKHFHSGRITYSHAVARAYELENKIAIYPRIVIDDNIIQMYKSGKNLPQIFNINQLVHQNGITFLNIIEAENWLEIYRAAKLIYENDSDSIKGNENAFQKHLWFEQYVLGCPFGTLEQKNSYIEKMTLL